MRRTRSGKLREIYETLEFRSFIRKMDTTQTDASNSVNDLGPLFGQFTDDLQSGVKETAHKKLNNVAHCYKFIDNEADAQKLCDEILTFTTVSFDTETTSVDAIAAQLVGLSFAVEGGKAWYVAVPRETEAARRMVHIFRPFYESDTILKVGQNIKYDLTVLANYGIDLHFPMFDTMLAHYLVQPELRHGMDYLAEVYLNYQTIHIEELIGPKGRGQKTWPTFRRATSATMPARMPT